MSLFEYCGYSNDFAKCKKFIISGRCDINEVDERGETPLMKACIFNNYLICDLLLRHKADINIENKQNITALNFALTDDLEDHYRMDLIYLFIKFKAYMDGKSNPTYDTNYNHIQHKSAKDLLIKSGYTIYGDNCDKIEVTIEFKKRRKCNKPYQEIFRMIMGYI
jgi:hypothetical protein